MFDVFFLNDHLCSQKIQTSLSVLKSRQSCFIGSSMPYFSIFCFYMNTCNILVFPKEVIHELEKCIS